MELKTFASDRAPNAAFDGDDRKGPRAFSLAALVEWTLALRLPKKTSERISNWEAPVLSPDQCRYAALDAWAGLRVYEALEAMEPNTVRLAQLQQHEQQQEQRQQLSAATASAMTGAVEAEGAHGGDDTGTANHVTAAAAADKQEALRPAQADAHRLHLQLGWSGAQIAASKGIKLSTADNYVADAMRAGRAYRFSVLGVPAETLGAIRRALETHRAACAACSVTAVTAAAAECTADPESARGLDTGVVGAADPFAAIANPTAAPSAATAATTGTAAAATYRATVRAVRELLASGAPPDGGAG